MILALALVAWLSFVEFRINGGRHTPALYFLLYMTALMIICTLLSSQMPFSVAGFFYLSVVSGAFWLGHLCTTMVFDGARPAEEHKADIVEMLATPVIWRSLVVVVIVGIAAAVLSLVSLFHSAQSAGVSLSGLGDLANLPAYFSAARYTTGGEDAEPIEIRFFTLFIEAGSACAGLMRAVKGTRRQRLLQYAPLFFALLMTLTTGSRSYFFLNGTWFFGSLISVLCVQGTMFKQLKSPSFWLKSTLAMAIAFIFGSAFTLLRFAAQNLQKPTFDQFLSQLVPIMASSLQSIVNATVIFDRMTVPGAQLHFAAYTFAPIMAWLGMESYRYPPTVYLSNGLSDSNQYSLPGFLLADFGPIITVFIYFVTGALAAASVHMARTGRLSFLPLTTGIMCVVLFSPFHNFFFWTTHVALFMLMVLFWSAMQYLNSEMKLSRT